MKTSRPLLLNSSTVIAESFALFTEQLRMHLGLVGHIQAVWFLERSLQRMGVLVTITSCSAITHNTNLFVRIDVDVALDAFLTVICPRVSGHPLPFALWALVLPEAALLALVRCLALGLWASL